jgi:hypothetical protein
MFDWTIKITDVAIVFATILGPVLAVQVQKYLERDRELKQRRVWIFRTLMATRATNLSAAHVDALNAVPIEFYGGSDLLKAIINQWKLYLDHLGKDPSPEAWGTKRVELLVELLSKMASCLGYDFNKVEIANEFYAPRGHASIESDQDIIRRGLAKLLNGELALPMDVKTFPSDPVVAKQYSEIQVALTRVLEGKTAVRVEVAEKE